MTASPLLRGYKSAHVPGVRSQMKSHCTAKVLLFVVLLLVPLFAHYATMESGSAPGIGFDILLYKPFNFAYVLMAWGLFLAIGLSELVLRDGLGLQAVSVAVATSGVVVVIWFFVAFLALAQLHLTLGGQL